MVTLPKVPTSWIDNSGKLTREARNWLNNLYSRVGGISGPTTPTWTTTVTAATGNNLPGNDLGADIYYNGINNDGVGSYLYFSGGIPTIDGVTITSGMRVLINNQTNLAQNGIYEADPTLKYLYRTKDFDNSLTGPILPGTTVLVNHVSSGTTVSFAQNSFNTNDQNRVGIDPISFSPASPQTYWLQAADLISLTNLAYTTYDNGPNNNGIGGTMYFSGGIPTIDGTSGSTVKMICVNGQTNRYENGLYTVTDNNTLTRSTTYDNSSTGKVDIGTSVVITGGTFYTLSVWTQEQFNTQEILGIPGSDLVFVQIVTRPWTQYTSIPTVTGNLGQISFDTSHNTYINYNGSTGWTQLNIPAGAAGGDLSGNYPNPSVVQLNGVPLGTGGVFTPSDTQILVGVGSSPTHLIPRTVGGDATLSNTGSLTVTKTNGVAFAASATTNTTIASNITSGTLPAARLPNPTASTLGGIESYASVSHQWINSISTLGVPSSTQPGFIDISGSVISTQMPALTGDVTSNAGTVSTTLATVNSNVGSFTNANITVNAKGLITAASNGSSASGTVTSVTLTGDGTVLSSTPSSAVTTSGTLTATLNTQLANKVLAGPTTGSAANPTFRSLIAADLPNAPTFSATCNTNQVIAQNTDTKVKMDTVEFDTNSNYDATTNYRFTPTVSGKYLISAQIGSAVNTAGQFLWLRLKKNGSLIRENVFTSAGGNVYATITTYIPMNGSTDYLEVWVECSQVGGCSLYGGTLDTFFSGNWVHS